MPRGRRFWTGPWGRFAIPYGYQYGGRCRWFPWLPRWWWTGLYGAMYPYSIPKEQEKTILKDQIELLEQELVSVKIRLEELAKSGG
jgi:hypothetical protein